MRIVTEGTAGTLESSDALVRVGPASGLRVDVRSSVEAQFGDQIRALVAEQLDRLGVTDAVVSVDDKGALDFVLRARLQGAVLRASEGAPDWSVL